MSKLSMKSEKLTLDMSLKATSTSLQSTAAAAATVAATACDINRKRMSTMSHNGAPEHKKVNINSLTTGFPATLKSYVAERKGEREEMQDANVCLIDCIDQFPQLQPKVNRASYFAVFDGHGGARASQYSAQNLHLHLAKHLPSGDSPTFDRDMKRSIIEGFKSLDEDFLKIASKKQPAWKDGTTTCCLLILDDALYIANLGDSQAILCRYQKASKKHVSVKLCSEHNPSNYDERKRIEKAGGFVRDGRVLGVLEVSRSIGDGQYKHCGVINTPEIKRIRQLTSDDRFILIACDGLWKVYTREQAVEFILQIIQDNTLLPPKGVSKTLETFRFEVACNKLASEAVRRGSADNVTVVIVSISKLS